jgi:hypothetical protein
MAKSLKSLRSHVNAFEAIFCLGVNVHTYL